MARKSACAKTSRARQVLFNLLRALYREHPVKIDIAGTVDSIAQITPELLYSCYRTFYNLNNMALVVAGSATAEQVLAVADRLLPASGDGERVKRRCRRSRCRQYSRISSR